MRGKNIIFNDKIINKINFYKNQKLFNIDVTDIDIILVSKREPHGKKSSFKYFIGHSDNDNIRPLCIKLPQMIGYAKYFDDNKAMLFKVTDKKLLKKYTKIRRKVSSLMNIEFGSKLVYGDNDKYIKTKIKLYGDKVNTKFQGENIPKGSPSYECL